MAQKQGIMSDAQTNHDVEIAAVRGKRLGLHDRVAHGLVSAAAVELFLVRHADLGLVLCTDLAADREIFDALCLENTGEDGSLSHQTDAGRDADLFITHALDELDGFLDTGQAAVKLAFNARGGAGNQTLFRVVAVDFKCFLEQCLYLRSSVRQNGGYCSSLAERQPSLLQSEQLCVHFSSDMILSSL